MTNETDLARGAPRTETTREDVVAYYQTEGCAHLALELHLLTGWSLAIVWDEEALDDWGEGDEPTPVHCLVIDPTSGEAVDSRGRRDVAAVLAEHDDLQRVRIDEQVERGELLVLCGDTRPFYEHTHQEACEAREAITLLALLA